MSSDPSLFDPYHKWLGIAPKDQPPHHYRLLGIEAFESDTEVIDSAAKGRMVVLAGHAQGPHAVQAAELMGQVAAARTCLLDPQSRAEYDAQLRQQRGVRRSQPARAPAAAWRDSPPARPILKAVVVPANQAEPEIAAFDPSQGVVTSPTSTARKVQIKRKAAQRQFRFRLAGQILAPVVGLAIGYWIVSSVDPRFDFLNLRGGRDLADRAPASARDDAPSKGSPKPRPVTTVKSGPSSSADRSQQTTSSNQPEKKSPDEPPKAAPTANPFAQVPASVALPPIPEGPAATPVTLARLDLAPDAEIQLALKSFVTGAKSANVFRFERVDSTGTSDPAPPRWNVLAHVSSKPEAAPGEKTPADPLSADAATTPVASFVVRDNSLLFAWLAEARSTYAAELRNGVLVLRSGTAEKPLPLRNCERIDAVRLGMDKSYLLTALPPDEAGPPPETLRLELLKTAQLPPGATVIPDSRQSGGTEEIRIVLRSEPPAVELRARLFTSGKNTSIRVAPVMADVGGKPVPFTAEHLNSLKQKAAKEIVEAEKIESTFKARIKSIEGEIPTLRTTVVTSIAAANRVKAKIAALQNESARATAEVDRLSKAIPEMKSKQQLFDPLLEIVKSVRDKATLRFRVFYVCEEQEVDLLRAG